MLTSHGISHKGLSSITSYVKDGHYQLACQKYFEITHAVSLALEMRILLTRSGHGHHTSILRIDFKGQATSFLKKSFAVSCLYIIILCLLPLDRTPLHRVLLEVNYGNPLSHSLVISLSMSIVY